DLWIKRDDLNAPMIGGNKVRALEFLLGSVRAGDTVLTLGGAGSTHVLATAIHARRLGAGTMAIRWQHDMNEIADLVSERVGQELDDTQIKHHALPQPRRIVLPLGTGTTMAGLAVGLAIAGLDIPVVGARVGPRLIANRRRVKSVVRATARAITDAT